MTITATDIEEHREERPRLRGAVNYDKIARHWYATASSTAYPPETTDGFTFTIPSAAEQRLIEEREKAFYALVDEVEGVDEVTDLMNSLTRRIRAIDRQLAEPRGGK